MNKQEAAKLLSLIKLSYPSAYRDIDRETANATVNMWQMSFPEVPYPIMEQAFNHFRYGSKFPPTVADMVQELKQVYYQALEGAMIQKNLENGDGVRYFRRIMDATSAYRDGEALGTINITKLKIEGGQYGEENGPAYPGIHRGSECRDELRKMEGAAACD